MDEVIIFALFTVQIIFNNGVSPLPETVRSGRQQRGYFYLGIWMHNRRWCPDGHSRPSPPIERKKGPLIKIREKRDVFGLQGDRRKPVICFDALKINDAFGRAPKTTSHVRAIFLTEQTSVGLNWIQVRSLMRRVFVFCAMLVQRMQRTQW